MIRYALACDRAHPFETWFPSAGAFDDQAARGLVACPSCGSTRVAKQIMAPSVARTDKAPGAVEAAPETPAPTPVLAEPERQLRAFMRALREHVTRNADDVGDRFAEEARRIHYGEEDERAIYGVADADEVRALMEEGIAIAPLPPAPDERN